MYDGQTDRYHLTALGRRTTLALIAGTVVLLLTVVWMLGNVLHWGRLGSADLRAEVVVPGALLVVALVALPVMLWGLGEEWMTSYTISDDGLIYQTWRPIRIVYQWNQVYDVRRSSEPRDDAIDDILVDPQAVRQIRNPLLRGLHLLALGRTRLPVYAGLEDRNGLVARIRARSQVAVGTDLEIGMVKQGV
ncbi:MAG: hypothetical protein NVSMB42_05150 [Herpetosiphon sp.]